jgi:MFS superfamily sulfate permease-like transporter
MLKSLRLFLNPFDARYEDLAKGPKHLVVLRDFSAGLIVAMMAIPLAMGFAMASGLKPEQGIVGGAVAGLIGALFGGSKYQVYGPTAAFIPLIGGLMAAYATPSDPYAGHGFLILASVIAGIVLALMGLAGLGRLAKWVPHSIVVGFTVGIAVTIALSQIGEVLGIGKGLETMVNGAAQDANMSIPGYKFLFKLHVIWEHLGEYSGEALLLAIVTFLVTKYLLKISIYIPAPLFAIAIGIFLSRAMSDGGELTLIRTKFGEIPTDFFVLTLPILPAWNLGVLRDLLYFVVAIVFVSGVESLLCSRMADRLADNRGTPFNPDKEFWGQGLVQIFVPLLNGFPHTGALARTATNIKLGAVTPLAGIFKCFLKLGLAWYLAAYLELVPMACIGGILMWVAANMVKPAEIRQVFAHNWFHVSLMVFTAVAVIITDFVTGVLAAMVLYGVLFKFLDTASSDQARREKHLADVGLQPASGGSMAAQPAAGPRRKPLSRPRHETHAVAAVSDDTERRSL